ncbi:hypothetical protein [Pontibacter roseus]|uniref:hypothetical protein n=1 Tax=Pontibacter roseus TaxID=336989 RepID=UPI0012F90D7F|nr:hypothetical protein [Pontibacter roseus]
MKKHLRITLSLTALLLAGCTSDFYPAVDERLTTLPVQPHNKEVEVFFAGEWPKEEYVKLAALEARGGESTPYITLINDLKARANAHGADALVVQGKGHITDVHSSADHMVSTTATSTLTGIAIKYRKNLDLGLMPKLQHIELYDSKVQAFKPLLNLQLGVGGDITGKEELLQNAFNFYKVYVQEYTPRNLLQEHGRNWQERRQEGFVVERQLSFDGILQKRMRFNYNAHRQLQQVVIEKSGRQPEEVQYTYNEAGQLTTRSINRDKKPYLREDYTYDADGKVSEVQLHIATKNGQEPLLRSTFAYYTWEEIR